MVAGDLSAVLEPRRTVRRATERVHSVLGPGDPGAPYDRKAALYDRVVPSRLYNRLLWGTDPGEYLAFARRAVSSSASGWLLDAGAGSAAFTAAAYRATRRPLVLLDRSLGMLVRAADRLAGAHAELPANVVLLQADLEDLPFAAGRFTTVLSMGVAHLVEDVPGLVRRLRAQLAPGGRLFVSGLVAETPVGRRYLHLLHRAGEVSRPRDLEQLKRELRAGGGAIHDLRRHGSMSYAVIAR